MKAKNLWIIGLWILVLAFAGSARAKDVEAYFDLNPNAGFFKMPYPSNIRRNADGTIDFRGFPPTGLFWIIGSYPEVASRAGFSTTARMYFRFTGPINTATLPATAKASLATDAKIMLIDIDANSPERGRRFPLIWKFYEKSQNWAGGGKDILAVMALPGFVLRENTTYAAIILKSVGAKNGALAANRELVEALNGRELRGEFGSKARPAYAPLKKWLAEPGCPVKTEDIAIATVFTTGDPTAELHQLWKAIQEMPLVQLTEWIRVEREYPDYYVLRTKWRAPQFQTGRPPFSFVGGDILYDREGKPIVQRYENVPLVITVPKTKMPDKGFPLLMFIHGTEGVSNQVVDRGYTKTPKGLPEKGAGPALIVAKRGIAAMGSALPQNGERGGDKGMLLYYSFFNATGIRNNLLQSAAEQMMLLRLFQGLKIPAQLCPQAQVPGKLIYFDPDLFFSMGQSLGSLVLGLFDGVDPNLKAVIPSGEGGDWALFASRGNFADIPSLNKSGKGMFEAIGIDPFHPAMMVFQTALAAADPLSFAPHVINHPLEGGPKQVWAGVGLYDHFFRPESQNALIAGLGLDLSGQVVDDRVLQYLEVGEHKQVGYPVSGNLKVDGKKVTGLAVQYKMDNILDGHHINYQLNDPKYQYGCFLQSVVKNGVGTVYAPKDLNEPCGP